MQKLLILGINIKTYTFSFLKHFIHPVGSTKVKKPTEVHERLYCFYANTLSNVISPLLIPLFFCCSQAGTEGGISTPFYIFKERDSVFTGFLLLLGNSQEGLRSLPLNWLTLKSQTTTEGADPYSKKTKHCVLLPVPVRHSYDFPYWQDDKAGVLFAENCV